VHLYVCIRRGDCQARGRRVTSSLLGTGRRDVRAAVPVLVAHAKFSRAKRVRVSARSCRTQTARLAPKVQAKSNQHLLHKLPIRCCHGFEPAVPSSPTRLAAALRNRRDPAAPSQAAGPLSESDRYRWAAAHSSFAVMTRICSVRFARTWFVCRVMQMTMPSRLLPQKRMLVPMAMFRAATSTIPV